VMDDSAGYEGSHKHSDYGSGRKISSGHLLFVRVKTDSECKACASGGACCLGVGDRAIPTILVALRQKLANDFARFSANSSLKSRN
jgi:hypothetical protein